MNATNICPRCKCWKDSQANVCQACHLASYRKYPQYARLAAKYPLTAEQAQRIWRRIEAEAATKHYLDAERGIPLAVVRGEAARPLKGGSKCAG